MSALSPTMESKVYLRHYRLALDEIGVPSVLRRSATEGTFKAEDTIGNEKVALQLIPIAELSEHSREQLEAEARLAQQIAHVNIPRVRDFGFEGDHFVYVTDFFDGTTAEDWIKERGPMPVGPVLRIGAQMVSAMAAAAFHGIFHGGLNPSNLMLVPGQTAGGEWPLIKVLNFVGVVPRFSPVDASAAGAQEAINFASPEQVEKGALDFRSEVYSLGCTLWFLLSGVPPLAGAATVESAPGLPAPVRQLLGSLLHADPQERPLDPVILQERFQDCLAQAERREVADAKLPAAVTPVVLRPRERAPFPMKALALAAAILLFGGLTAVVLPKFRGAQSVDQLGVPIGVAEPLAAPVIAQTEPAPAMVASEPAVLTSTANAADETADGGPVETAQNNPAAESETSAPVAVDSEPAPSSEGIPAESARVVENQAAAAEPRPPSEGPPNETLPVPNESSGAIVTYAKAAPATVEEGQTETSVDMPSPPPLEESARPLPIAPPPRKEEKKITLAHVERVPAEPARVARRGTRRPHEAARRSNAEPVAPLEFIGVTPEGEPVFGPPPSRRHSANRQPRRPGERVENLPVLRALPPDQ
ncbi:MAG: serine/threonine protein kinase [Chthoniobacterales bacterium]